MWPMLMREKTIASNKTSHGRKSARDYRAEMLLTPNPQGGTDIRWTGSFTEGLRGTSQIMRIFLRGVVGFLVNRLVKAAERE